MLYADMELTDCEADQALLAEIGPAAYAEYLRACGLAQTLPADADLMLDSDPAATYPELPGRYA